MDVGSEFITGLKSTPGNRADNPELPVLSDPPSQTLTADKIYESKRTGNTWKTKESETRLSQSKGVEDIHLSQRSSGPGSNASLSRPKNTPG